jgi:hypothetical protein
MHGSSDAAVAEVAAAEAAAEEAEAGDEGVEARAAEVVRDPPLVPVAAADFAVE